MRTVIAQGSDCRARVDERCEHSHVASSSPGALDANLRTEVS
jgi:hypothetical protein